MVVRISSLTTKIGLVVLFTLLAPLVAISADVLVGAALLDVAYAAALLAFAAFCARTFRGRGEAVAPPRAWWRMSANPLGGFVTAGLLAASIAWGALGGGGSASVVLVSEGLVAVALLLSSVRLQLRRQRDERRSVPLAEHPAT